MRKINPEGLELIKTFEGLKLKAYKDIVGIRTIGYGHTGSDVVDGQQITPMQAELLLTMDVEKFERGVDNLVKIQINDNQFSALVSFAFNLGLTRLEQSTLLKLLNQKKIQEAADQFLVWNKAGGKVVAGLTRRREAERALFLKPETFSTGSSA